MHKKMREGTPIFWGCTLLHNYPFLMENTKAVLDSLEVKTIEVEDFSCCPDPVYVRAYNKDKHLAISARNLSLAERHGKKLLVACNGCWNVLSNAKKELEDKKTKNKINELLPENRRYEKEIEVEHIGGLLYAKLPIIKTLVKRPLSGLRVGVHYGCHILYPTATAGDDPRNPKSLDEVIEATGARSVNYESKLSCCGVSVMTFDSEEANRLLAKKLSDLKGKVDCIVTACPACFMRFDILPQELRADAVPVLHISELLCIAFGMLDKLFLEGHNVKIKPLIEKLDTEPSEEIRLLKEGFDSFELASHCGACSKECVAAAATKDSMKPFDPLNVVNSLNEGRLYEAINCEDIWRCLQCGKCEERCPHNMGLKELFAKLRELSLASGKKVKLIEEKIKMLEETGYGMPKRIGIRKRMGIPPAPDMDATEIKQILTKEECENDKIVH